MTDKRVSPKKIQIYDGRAQLWRDIADVHSMHARYFGPEAPFYWLRPSFLVDETDCYISPSGWYQWTGSGLTYLGKTIL